MLYIVHGEDDSAALTWLSGKKETWLPTEWRTFNFHPVDARKISLEDFRNTLLSYPMGSDYRVILLREMEKADASRKKQFASLLGNLPRTTIVVLWFIPGPKDPKKLPLGVDWKETLKEAQFVKCTPPAPEEDTSVFSLLDGLGERRTSKALKSLKNLLEQGEPPLRLMAALTNQIRLLWQIKSLEDEGRNSAEIAKRLAIHPYRVIKAVRHAGNFKGTELPRFFDWLSRADHSLKTGRQEPEHLLELLVLRLCQG